MLQDIKPTPVTLQLEDISLAKPNRVIEYVCMGVNKYILSTDFIILEMEEDNNVLLILGRP